MRFQTASRTAGEMTAAKDELNNIFLEAVRGNHGTYNPRGVEVLRANKMDIAELMVQIIKDEVVSTDPTPFLVDTMSGEITKDYAFQKLDGSLRVVKRSYGSKPLSQRLTFKEYSLTTSMKEIAVELPLEEVAGGRITPSQMAEEMAQAINRYRISTILDGIDAAVQADADHTGLSGYVLRYTGFTKENLDKAIDGLLDEGGSPVIYGRHTAIYPAIRAFDGWADETIRDFNVRGQVGGYMGAPIVILKDTFNKTAGEHFLSNERIYLASGKKGAKFMTKDVSFLNWAEVSAKNASFGTGIRLEDGLLVDDPFQYRIITTS